MKTKKQTARKDAQTAGKTAKKNSANGGGNVQTRVERWRKLAGDRLASLEMSGRGKMAIIRTCAEIEGVSPVEIIVRRLMYLRGGGKIVTERPADTLSPEWYAYIDTDYELNAATRKRNNHEMEIVNGAIFDYYFGAWIPNGVSEREKICFVRRFYRKGDKGLFTAYRRMIKTALAPDASGGAGGKRRKA